MRVYKIILVDKISATITAEQGSKLFARLPNEISRRYPLAIR